MKKLIFFHLKPFMSSPSSSILLPNFTLAGRICACLKLSHVKCFCVDCWLSLHVVFHFSKNKLM